MVASRWTTPERASVCRTEAGKPQLGLGVGGHNISTSTTPAATPSDPYGIPSQPVCRAGRDGDTLTPYRCASEWERSGVRPHERSPSGPARHGLSPWGPAKRLVIVRLARRQPGPPGLNLYEPCYNTIRNEQLQQGRRERHATRWTVFRGRC